MSRKKPTVEDARTLREQMEGHICDLVIQYEELTGLTVTGVEVRHERKPGFGEKDRLDIRVNTLI